MIRKSYINHIFISILICIAIPSAILFGIIQFDYDAYGTYHVSQVASKQLDYKGSDAQRWVREKKVLIDEYALAVEAYIEGYGFNEGLSDFLTELSHSDPEIQAVYVKTQTNQDYVSEGVKPISDEIISTWYQGAITRDVFVSRPTYKAQLGEVGVTFSKTIRDEKRMLQGVIAVDVPLSYFIERIKSASRENQFEILLVSDETIVYADPVFDGYHYDYFRTASGTLEEIELSGATYAGRRVDVGIMQSELYVFLNVDAYQLEKNVIINTFLHRKGLFLSVIVFSIFLFNEFLYRPLTRLGKYIAYTQENVGQCAPYTLPRDLQKIQGIYKKLVEVASAREFQVRQMTGHVAALNADIESTNSELERSYDKLKGLNDLLEEKEKEYTDFVNNIPDMIWVCSTDGTLVYANEYFKGLTGLDANSDKHIVLSDFMDGFETGCDITSIFVDRDYSQIVLDMKCSDGKVHNMEGSISRIFEGDKIVAIQGIFRDMSDSKAMYLDYFNRNRELTLVNDITKSLISNLDLDIVLSEIAEKVGRIMRIGMCTIRLIDGEHLRLSAHLGTKHQVVYDSDPLIDRTHMGVVCKENRTRVIESKDDFTIEEKALERTLDTIHCVVYVPLSINDIVYGVMSVAAERAVDSDNISILETLADQAAIAIERTKIFENLRSNYFKTIEALVAANDAKAPNMEGHTKRVSDVAVEVGKRMYLRQEDMDSIYIAGLLHDIGKMNIEDSLLSKNELTEDEKAIIDEHPMMAKKILEPIGMSDAITQGIYYHHKRFDLTGEPKGEDIESLPLIARIIGVVDDLDSYLVGRKESISRDLLDVIHIIKKGVGTIYCPEVVKILEEIAHQDPNIIMMHYEQTVKQGEVAI